MKRLRDDLRKKGFRGELRRDEPLANHTSWKLGGPADLFAVPRDCDDLQLLLRTADEQGVSWMVIGKGSNLLVADAGIRGLVIYTGGLTKIDFLPGGMVEAEAGVPLAHLIKACCKAGLGGLEELLGIPGTLGGAVLMNAGALETEIGDLVSQVFLTDGYGEWTLRQEQIEFAYRRSSLQGEGVISRVALQLRPADENALKKRCAEVEERRRQTQKLAGAHAGSVFKNPPEEKAWQLIDRVGLRGKRCGKAQIAETHCNHILNLGQAKACDVMQLIDEARDKVAAVCGVELELEVHLAGWEERK